MFVAAIVVAEAEHNRRADEGIFFADLALKEAFPGPVKQAEIAPMHHEPRWTNVGLDDVFGLWTGVFEAGRWVLDDGFAEDFVKFGSFDFLMAGSVDFGGELE